MDIKKAFEKLNSIDAKDLKKLDLSKLKDLNIDRIKEELATKPKILFNTIFAIVAVGSILYSVGYYKTQVSQIQSEITSLNQKLEMINLTASTETKYKDFLANLPKVIPNNQLIGKISEFAEKTNINVITYSPLKTDQAEFVNQYVVNLSIKADTYQDLINFINIIENSNFTLKVRKVGLRANAAYMREYQGEEEIPLDAYIEIGSIQLNNV